jgi:cobalt-zinc-cadmium resistance protein CzcA
MIERIVEYSTRNRALVAFVVLLLAAMGVRAMLQLPIDAVPDVTNVQVQVLAQSPALAPLEIEQYVTLPVESVMGGLPHLEEIRSTSQFGLSAVTLVFEDGTDIYWARQLVAERLADLRGSIPENAGMPEMAPISTGLGQIYQFEVRGEPACAPGDPDTDRCYSPMELRTLLDWQVVPLLRRVPGVVEVNVFGGELRTYEVRVLPERLVSYKVPLDELFEALRRNNANAGGAYLVHAGEQRVIRGEGLVSSLDDIRRIVVATRGGGTPVYVRDLADVVIAPRVRQGAVTRDGHGEIVTGIVMMLMGANSREVARAVERRIAEIQPTLPKGVTIDTYYDRTELVDRTIRTVAKNLLEGGALVIVVLFLMLGNVRSGLLVALAIPLSMFGAFIGMRLAGVSGNLMSLGAIDFGLIVDGSVVVVENVMRATGRFQERERPLLDTVSAAAREVARPAAFAVAIIMIVYIPILTLQGIEGRMFRPMALTVLFALGCALALSLTLMPALSSVVFRKGVRAEETWLVRRLHALYEPTLRRVVRRPWITAGVALIAFVASLTAIPYLGAEFVPQLDEGAIAIEVLRLASVSLDESIHMSTQAEQALLERYPDEVKTVVSLTGRPEIATDPVGVQSTDVFVILRLRDQWKRPESTEELMEKIADTLRHEAPGQQYELSQPIRLRTNELLSGFRSAVAISIYGDDLDILRQLGDRVARSVASVPGAAGVRAEQIAGSPILNVQVDRAAVARYGLNASTVLDAVSALGGHPVGEVFEGQRRFTLLVRFPDSSRNDAEAIRRLPLLSSGGRAIPMGQVARVVEESGPAQISRHDGQRRLTVQTNVGGRDLAGFVREAQRAVGRDVTLPPGYRIAWGGQYEHLRDASARLTVVVPMALLLVFLLLFMAFGAVRPALLIFLNVPIAATGGILALLVRGMPFSISAGVGFIALFGVAVLNGVVLLAYVRQLQTTGLSALEASIQGASMRLRPVMTTALVASFGFIPMAISTSAGAEVQRPLATVVIGGLITSTVLTLFVLPAIYAATSRIKVAESESRR